MADKKKKGKVSGAIKAVGADIKDIGTTFANQKAVGKRNCIFGFGGSFYPIYGVLRGRIS